jgi:hypothetical protein
MDESERVELINRSNYWGILTFSEVEEILHYIRRLNLCPSTGWFLWETKCVTSVNGQHNVAVALTQLRCVTSHGHYVSKMDCLTGSGFQVAKFRPGNPDTYTVYIVKSPRDGRYYEYKDLEMVFLGQMFTSKNYAERYSSDTLSDAIECILLRYSTYEELTYWPGKAHNCEPFSRFVSVCYNRDSKNRPHIPKLWSLQHLCLFFLRNYLRIYDHYDEPRLPKTFVDMIVGMSAVKLCAPKSRTMKVTMNVVLL